MKNRGLLIGLIPARGGSKGIPRKNLRSLTGRPLIAHAISIAKACPSLDRVVVSTEDQEIANVAKSLGADVPFLRSPDLARDNSPMMPVLKDAIDKIENIFGQPVHAVVLLDPTSPMRTQADVEGAIKMFHQGNCDAVVSGAPAHRSPHFNMVQIDKGYARLVVPVNPPLGRRQDAPSVFDLDTTVWVFSRKAIMELKSRLPEKTKLFLVPSERSRDLDTEADWRYVEFLMSNLGARA